jgi:hypothetical protein
VIKVSELTLLLFGEHCRSLRRCCIKTGCKGNHRDCQTHEQQLDVRRAFRLLCFCGIFVSTLTFS